MCIIYQTVFSYVQRPNIPWAKWSKSRRLSRLKQCFNEKYARTGGSSCGAVLEKKQKTKTKKTQ